MSDDRPKKSWKEIDAMRDKSRGSTSRKDPAREKAQRSAAYSKYKSQLDQLFKPGGADLPESLKEKLGPVSEEGKQKRELLDALEKSQTEETLSAVVEAGVPLPETPRLLMSCLAVQDEALIRPVLEKLLEIVEDGKKPNRMLLIQRLEAVKNWAEEDETVELVSTLRAALDG